MRKLAIAFAATLLSTASAFAAEIDGVVAEVNADARTVVLEDGTSLVIAEGVDFSNIIAGDPVAITTDDASGQVTEIILTE